MTGDVEVPGPGRYPWAVRVAAGIVAILGLAVLAGWILERPALARLGSREVPVAPSTAFLFVLFAGAILLRMRAAAAPRAVPGATIAGGALALTLLLLSSLGIHLDVEHPWIAIGHALGSPPLAHMSPVTAGCFVVVALSLLVGVRGRRPWVLKAGRWGAGVVTGIGLVLGLGYLYGTPFLYRGAFIPPAFLTSGGFLVLGAALLGVLAPPAGPPAEVHARSARLLIGIFAVLAAGTVGAGFLLQRSFEARYRAEVEQELLAIADLKTRELETWRAERVADAAMFLDNPAFNALAGRVFADGADEAARAEVRDWFVRVATNQPYSRLSLLDRTGAERLALPDTQRGAADVHRVAIGASLRDGRIAWVDIHRDDPDGDAHLIVIAPLGNGRDGAAALGAVTLAIDVRAALYPLLAWWPAPSRTADVSLVRLEGGHVRYLTPLRFRADAALALRAPLTETDRPVVQAALGATGIVYGHGYRGEPVVAAVRAVPGSPWLLVARMDVAEAFAAVRARLWLTLLLVGVLVTGAGAGVRTIWQEQRLRGLVEVRDRERQLAIIGDNFPGLVARLDRDLRYRFASAGFAQRFGLPPESVVGRGLPEVIGPEAFALARPYLDRALAGERVAYENVLTDVSGAQRRMLVTLVPDPGAGDTVQGVFVVALDITERLRVQEALRSSEERYRRTLDSMREGFQIIGRDWRYVYVNDAAAAHGRRPKDDLLGRTMMEVYPGIERTSMFEVLRRCMEDREFHRLENAFTQADGSTTWFDLSVDPVPDGISVVSLDITERHRAEEALRVSEERLRLALAASSQGLYDLDVQTGRAIVSPEYARTLGYAPEALEETNARWLERLHPDDREVVGRAYDDYIAGRRADYRVEFRQHTKDGRWVWILSLGRLVAWDAEGRPLRMLGTHTDITARKLAEEELRESREQIRKLAFAQEQTRELERQRLAAELHDELGGALTAIKMDLSWLADRAHRDAMDLGARAAEAMKLVDTTVDTVRRISAELRPGVLDDLGLAAAIQGQARDFQRRSGLPVTLSGLDAVPPLDPGRALAVFRILQEALTNVARHANATQIAVTVAAPHARLQLQIRDDGGGPYASTARERSGLGILGMQERAAAWGGTVVIGENVPHGTVVTLDMPVNPA
jgi:PAS domain S-box-containing protein